MCSHVRATGHADADVYSKLDEDYRKNMIYKMDRIRDEDGSDVGGGAIIKDRNRKLVT